MVSHAIRRMQRAGVVRPEIDYARLKALWAEAIPNPQQQLDNFVLLLGDADLPLDHFMVGRVEKFCAEIGTEDDPIQGRTGGFNLVVQRLIHLGFIQSETRSDGQVGYRLTFEGWARYEQLKHQAPESHIAFIAMDFHNEALTTVVGDFFVPAVRETGFELHRLDSRPKSGLIDNRLRVELRGAKFVVCDLTDENRGAYWEAGFAEGASKKVYYTCEKAKFEKAKSHFDTEHLFTVKWDPKDPSAAANELRDAIRNDFPGEATPPDLSKSR